MAKETDGPDFSQLVGDALLLGVGGGMAFAIADLMLSAAQARGNSYQQSLTAMSGADNVQLATTGKVVREILSAPPPVRRRSVRRNRRARSLYEENIRIDELPPGAPVVT